MAGLRGIIQGLVVALVGLILAGPVISTAVTAGTTTGIGSFVGTQALNDLIPTLYYLGLMGAVLVVTGVLGQIGSAVRRRRGKG
jgi:hypothetical protein